MLLPKKYWAYLFTIATVYIPIGASFGGAFVANGFSPEIAVLYSMTSFAASSQLAMSSIATLDNVLIVILTTFAINSRHIFYGIALKERTKSFKGLNFLLAMFLTDEVFASLTSDEDNPQNLVPRRVILFGFFAYLLWVFGTVLGSYGADRSIISPNSLKVALPVLFILFFMGNIKKVRNNKAKFKVILVSIGAVGVVYFSNSPASLSLAILTSFIILLVINYREHYANS